jgi:manganese/iron transport system permease protein
MVMVAVTIGLCASVLGIYISFFLDSAPAPTIVLLMTATFIGAFIRTTMKPTLAAAID